MRWNKIRSSDTEDPSVMMSSDTEDLSAPIIVNSCGYEKFITQDMHIRRKKGRADYNIIYIAGGKGHFPASYDPANIIEANKGSVVVFAPGQPQIYDYYASENTETYWAHFTGHSARGYLNTSGIPASDNTYPAVYFTGIDDAFTGIFKEIIFEMQVKESFYENRSAALLLGLMALMGRRADYAGTNSRIMPDMSLKKALDSMNEKYCENLPLKYYADVANLSLFRFMHKFRDVMGVTPKDYIKRIRMEKARHLLVNTGMSIAEVAGSTGYEDPLYFSRVFSRETGVSPRGYRNSRKSN
ncbi:MAG: AraC family transcriptional regulator [Eubacteriales bacterium]|nr:AraC family transcriptional regulator [Eubacteriales bacterium]